MAKMSMDEIIKKIESFDDLAKRLDSSHFDDVAGHLSSFLQQVEEINKADAARLTGKSSANYVHSESLSEIKDAYSAMVHQMASSKFDATKAIAQSLAGSFDSLYYDAI